MSEEVLIPNRNFWRNSGLHVLLASIAGLFAWFVSQSDSEASFAEQLQQCMIDQRLLIQENIALSALKDDRVAALMAFADRSPWPMWLREANLITRADPVMLWVNRAYYLEYGIDTFAYQGRTDREVWGNAIGGSFVELDWKVIDGRRPVTTLERVPVDPMNPDGPINWVIVTKYMVENHDGANIVWVGGILVPDKFVRLAMDHASKSDITVILE